MNAIDSSRLVTESARRCLSKGLRMVIVLMFLFFLDVAADPSFPPTHHHHDHHPCSHPPTTFHEEWFLRLQLYSLLTHRPYPP